MNPFQPFAVRCRTRQHSTAWLAIVRVGTSVLGLVLLFAAVSKSIDAVTPSYAVEQVFGWDRVLAWRMVFVVAIFEAVIGTALIFRFAPRALSLVVFAALIGMTAFLVQLMRVDPGASCGCTIVKVKLPGASEISTAIVRNAALIGLSVITLFGHVSRQGHGASV